MTSEHVSSDSGRLAALKSASRTSDDLELFRNKDPKCPHCGYVCRIADHEWWELYDDGDHEVTCPSCDREFTVETCVSYSFSTNEQVRDDDC
jgi:uncharacterized Zn-finger protein